MTVKVCEKDGCKFRVKKDSDRVFCYRHDPNYMSDNEDEYEKQIKSLVKKYIRN